MIPWTPFTYITTWNSILAVANGLQALFDTATFPTNPSFSTRFFKAMAALNIKGAGVNVTFDSAHDAIFPYDIFR